MDFDLNIPVYNSDDDITGREDGNEGGEKMFVLDESFLHVGFPPNKSFEELTVDDFLKLQFKSVEKADSFYVLYGKMLGFSVRRYKKWPNKDGKVITRSWICSRQGKRAKKYLKVDGRKREAKALTRVDCKAWLRIIWNEEANMYSVKDFIKEHTHAFARKECAAFLRSNRILSTPDKAIASSLRRAGLKQSQIMGVFVNQSGSYENIGFIQKDLQNFLDNERRANVSDGDAQAALTYLAALSDNSLLFHKYNVDENNCLGKLFWSDTLSRLDYACFGDVLVFDTTYRTNAYKKPFVILTGVDNHDRAVIFGCALLANETVETYVWVLETFLEAMSNKAPKAVITDRDKAMRKAIKIVLPGCVHRLCGWHLAKNATSNVKNLEFTQGFARCLTMNCSPENFEEVWEKLLADCGLGTDDWVANV